MTQQCNKIDEYLVDEGLPEKKRRGRGDIRNVGVRQTTSIKPRDAHALSDRHEHFLSLKPILPSAPNRKYYCLQQKNQLLPFSPTTPVFIDKTVEI